MRQQLLKTTTKGGTNSPQGRYEYIDPAGLNFLDRPRSQIGQFRQSLLSEISGFTSFPDIAPNRL